LGGVEIDYFLRCFFECYTPVHPIRIRRRNRRGRAGRSTQTYVG
jgi:hypothetical protein